MATGWGYSKDFPRFAGKTFRERYKDLRKRAARDIGKWENTYTGKQVDSHTGNRVQADDLVTQFTRELAALGGQVHLAENITEEIIEFMQSKGLDKIHLVPNVLDEPQLRSAGIKFTREPDPEILVGVTRAVCGLADTGSILETEGPGNPLHASLLPEIHIAVLSRSDILPSLPDAMPLIREKERAVFITGPSVRPTSK